MPTSPTPDKKEESSVTSVLRSFGLEPRDDIAASAPPPPDDRPLVTAEAFLAYIAKSKGLDLKDSAVHSWVIASFQGTTIQHTVEATGATQAPFWDFSGAKVWHGKAGTTPVSVAKIRVGAPSATTDLEELIASGARNILVLGVAGALQADLAVGSFVLATGAIREEGTSFHYVPAGVAVTPDPDLTAAVAKTCAASGVAVRRGLVWTTDAPYRELASKVRTYAASGTLAVEMEAAALFALGMQRRVRIALLMAISDHLSDPWQPAFSHEELAAARPRLAQVALDTIAHATASYP